MPNTLANVNSAPEALISCNAYPNFSNFNNPNFNNQNHDYPNVGYLGGSNLPLTADGDSLIVYCYLKIAGGGLGRPPTFGTGRDLFTGSRKLESVHRPKWQIL